MENKKILRSAFIGFLLLFIALLITGIVGISDLINSGTGQLYGHTIKYGFANSLTNFWLIWRPGLFAHETAYIGEVLFFVAIFSALAIIILSIKNKKPVCIIPAIFLAMSIGYLPFILILVVPMVQLGVLRAAAMGLLSGVTGLTLFAIYFEILACKGMIKEAVKVLDKVGGVKEEEKEEQPVAAGEGLSEEEVKEIVEKYMQEHLDELHPRLKVPYVEKVPAEEPVEEEPVEEEPVEEEPAPVEEPVEEPAPVEEPVEEEPEEEEPEEEEEEEEEAPAEAPADDNSPVGPASKGKRRRANFETRLKNSEFDLRHKYYDLRDYIKWYGLRNRISIPGDTFSYKRQRYVFVTIVGKHIRVYLGLDPNAYADSTIPVESAAAKKYEDLPCLLRVKSDLSYRRAKKLVDDLMQKIGLEKPDEDEPKETQKPE